MKCEITSTGVFIDALVVVVVAIKAKSILHDSTMTLHYGLYKRVDLRNEN